MRRRVSASSSRILQRRLPEALPARKAIGVDPDRPGNGRVISDIDARQIHRHLPGMRRRVSHRPRPAAVMLGRLQASPLCPPQAKGASAIRLYLRNLRSFVHRRSAIGRVVLARMSSREQTAQGSGGCRRPGLSSTAKAADATSQAGAAVMHDLRLRHERLRRPAQESLHLFRKLPPRSVSPETKEGL